jgi:hypothetical protein
MTSTVVGVTRPVRYLGRRRVPGRSAERGCSRREHDAQREFERAAVEFLATWVLAFELHSVAALAIAC